jgi:hypothetical protein
MTVVAMDTYEVVKELMAAGFTDEQAQAVTRVVRRAQDVDVSNLATKTDLLATKTDLELRLAELKAELLKWLIGTIGIQTVAVIGALLALVRSVAHG